MNALCCRLVAMLAVGIMLAVSVPPAQAQAVAPVDQWHLGFLDIEQAHRYSQGAGVVVAVIDSGVDATHPDLAGSVLPGTQFGLAGVSGDGRTDSYGHGTSMAGLIAAHGRSEGIAPEAKILPITNGASGLPGDTDKSVDWAIAHGADVLCIAQGVADTSELRNSVRNALEANVVVVAAAGNQSTSATMQYPARYPGVIAAGGVDRDGNHAAVSVTGPELGLTAPAVDIRSTYLNHGYGTGTGTSAATAIIAGVAALVRAKYPQLTATQVVDRLLTTATDKGPTGHDDQYGYGIVNPVAALTTPLPTPTPSASTATPPPTNNHAPLIWITTGLAVISALGLGLILTHRRHRQTTP